MSKQKLTNIKPMLTLTEYNTRWRISGITNQLIPSYEDYKQRESVLKKQIDQFSSDHPIRYILIGEAAPSSGKYIYFDAEGSYITAPLKAFGLASSRKSKDEKWKALRNQGVLLLDFYPFAINYTSQIRKQLIKRPLFNQCINDLTDTIDNLNRQGKLAHDWDFCTVGPKITSCGILDTLDQNHNGCLYNKSTSAINDAPLNAISFKNHTSYTPHTPTAHFPLKAIPKRAKITVGIGMTGPHAQLIKRAFNLP